MKQIRIEIRARNNILWHKIFDEHGSVLAFCRAFPEVGSQGTVGGLLNLKRSPVNGTKKGKQYTLPAKRLARHFGMLEEDLFPDRLYEIERPQLAIEIPFSQLDRKAQPFLLPDAETAEYRAKEKTRRLLRTLAHLGPRYLEIVKMRFGLDGCREMSQEEIGKNYDVSKARISQIEKKAINRMRRSHEAALILEEER